MKRQILISLILLSSVSTMNAQTWNSSTSGNIYYNQGNVAIGKTTPNATLDINGNINFGNGTDATMNFNSSIGSGLYGNGANLRIVPIANNVTPILTLRPSTGSTTIPAIQLQDHPSSQTGNHSFILGTGIASLPANAFNISSTIIGLTNENSYPINFNLSNTTSGRFTAMMINYNGNVGIGTTNPAYSLDVIGTIRAREIKVDLNGADFVFEKDYKLMPLNELEKFVKEQKHLPEITPAKEMEKNGTELGDLNSKLLQKIEELTLYTIEQNKVIEELKQAQKLQSEEIEKLKASK